MSISVYRGRIVYLCLFNKSCNNVYKKFVFPHPICDLFEQHFIIICVFQYVLLVQLVGAVVHDIADIMQYSQKTEKVF